VAHSPGAALDTESPVSISPRQQWQHHPRRGFGSGHHASLGRGRSDKVTFEKTTYNQLPFKFEAGTMNYAGAIGLARSLEYINSIGLSDIEKREKELLNYATERLSAIKGLKIIGTSSKKIAIISFLLEDIHQYDTGTILDKMGIAVRTGTHCAQPVMNHFGIEGTVRASLCFYNTVQEIDILAEGLERVKKMFL
jgi:cysteine desulfurase/selenocysteine lyase